MKTFLTVLSFAFLLSSFAQDESIKSNSFEGFAPEYLGESVEILMYEDYLTKTTKLLATSYVDEKDSIFKASFQNANPKEIIIKIGDVQSHLYVSPGEHYDIYFPKPDEEDEMSSDNERVTAQIMGLKEDDINYKIISFDLWVDDFLNKHSYKIMDSTYSAELDTFINYVQDFYKDENNPYFLSYVRYSLGELQMMEKTDDELSKRFMIYVGYIRKFPIIYGHSKYMSFVLNFYDQIFNRFSSEDEEKIYDAIVKSSPHALHQVLKKDKTLENNALRELALIQALGKAFHQKTYPQQMILNVLDSIQQYPLVEENKVFAINILNKLTEIAPGNPAPDLELKDIDGKTISWKKLKGKYVYLNFFNTQNSICIKEMKLINTLKEKYEKDIEFISISVDEDIENVNKFLEKNPNIDWRIAHYNDDKALLKRYNIKSTPAYFLVDPEGFFVQAPALGPSPNSEYLTIDYYLFEIYKALNPEEKFTVGQKEN